MIKPWRKHQTGKAIYDAEILIENKQD